MQQLSRLPHVLLDWLVLAHSSSLRPYRPLFEFEEEYLISYGWSPVIVIDNFAKYIYVHKGAQNVRKTS